MYQRYGLNENPFNWHDPLDEPAHFLTVEGFGDQKPIIDSAFTKVTRSHFVLIHGISGTGRTSVSNYVAHVFAHGADAMKVVYSINDDAHKVSFHEWMESFVFQAELEGFAKIPEYFAPVGDASSATKMQYVRFLYNSLAELKAKEKPLIAIFENVKNPQLFEIVRSVFDPQLPKPLPDFPLVIFTSSDETVSNSFGNLNPRPAGPDPIKLRALTGKDVLTFITEKWTRATKSQPQPFDSNAIVEFFEIPRFPLKRAIEALNSIFEEKLKTLPDGDDWPTDTRLAIANNEIAAALIRFQNRTQFK
jgi:hypothetical protein